MTHAGDGNRYVKNPPFAINYNWSDSTTNTGYIRYYPCAASEDGGIVYFISTQVIDAKPLLFADATSGDSPEINFDLEPFRVPVTIRGRAIINSTLAVGINTTFRTKFLVYHVTALGAETQIGAENTAAHSPGGASGSYRDCVEIALTETNFEIGSKLRLAVMTNAGAVQSRSIYFDPSSRTTGLTDKDNGTTIGSDMTFDVPFKLIE